MSKIDLQKYLRKLLILFLSFSIFLNVSILPSNALSTVIGCFSNAVCATNLTGSLIAIGSGVAGLFTDGDDYVEVSPEDVQEAALNNFCSVNPDSCPYTLVYCLEFTGNPGSGAFCSRNGSASLPIAGDSYSLSNGNQGSNNILRVQDSKNEYTVCTWPSSSSDICSLRELDFYRDWDSLDPDDQEEAIRNLPPSHIEDIFNNNTYQPTLNVDIDDDGILDLGCGNFNVVTAENVTSEYICFDDTGERVDIDPPLSCTTNPYGSTCQNYCTDYPALCPVEAPPDPPSTCESNPYGIECQNFCSIYPSRCPTPPPAGDDNEDTEGGENSDPPVQCGLAPLPPCDIEIRDPDEILPPELIEPEFPTLPDSNNEPCADCNDSNFSNQNFLSYALTKFSDKFPFDVIGDYSILPDDNQCPSLTIYGKYWEFCVIPNTVSLIKYPVWISFLVRLILH